MNIAIIDYGSGNLRSAQKAFERATKEAGLNAACTLVTRPEDVRNSDYIVLPGVGAYADCRAGLNGISGMVEALEEAIISQAKPFLGICVGMQLMATRGLEKSITEGLGWISGDVTQMRPEDKSLKIPQIGWNTLDVSSPHPVLNGIETGADGLHAYFVHSYHLECEDQAQCLATVEYGQSVTAMVGRDNMVGTQFHPEKSQRLGLKLISNFLEWKP